MAQTGTNIIVAVKVEATLNVAPGATGAEKLRLTPSPGLKLTKEAIRSNEIRPDQLSTIPRHGSRAVEGSYNGEMSVGSFDTALEGSMRSTWVTAVTITEATGSLVNIFTGTNTIEAPSTITGDGWLDAGLRVGDVFRLTGHHTAANNDLNLRVKTLSTGTITVHGTDTLTAEASLDTAFTITIGKKLTNPTTPTRLSYTFDEYNQDIDLSERLEGCRFTRFRLAGSPNGMAEVEFGIMGMSVTALATGTSPYFTTPTEYTTDPLVFADALISYGGSEIAVATAFELVYEVQAATLPVIGSTTTPDVFDNEARLSGSITFLREDLARLSNFIDEDVLELHILLEEKESDPQDYISIYVPRIKIMDIDSALGSDGAMVETLPWEAGVKAAVTATGFDGTLLSILTSAS